VRNCRTYQGADILSDHSLVMCKIQLRLGKKDKKGKRHEPKRDIEALQQQEVRRAYKERIGEGIENDMMDQTMELNERAQKLNSIKKKHQRQ